MPAVLGQALAAVQGWRMYGCFYLEREASINPNEFAIQEITQGYHRLSAYIPKVLELMEQGYFSADGQTKKIKLEDTVQEWDLLSWLRMGTRLKILVSPGINSALNYDMKIIKNWLLLLRFFFYGLLSNKQSNRERFRCSKTVRGTIYTLVADRLGLSGTSGQYLMARISAWVCNQLSSH